jgi:hypothetical protein
MVELRRQNQWITFYGVCLGPNDCSESLVLNANAVQRERNGAGLNATETVCPKQLTKPTIVRDCRDL